MPMSHRTLLEVMREGGYAPKAGRPVPLELIYQCNTISYQEYQAEVERQRKMSQAGRNAAAISEMENDASLVDERAKRAGVPKRFLGYALDLTQIDALNNGNGIYVCGPQETGKTTLACSMLRGWLKENPFGTAKFVRSTTLIDNLNDTYSSNETIDAVMAQYATAGLLLVDDIGKEVPTVRAVSRLWELFDRRYGSVIPTIVTSQYGPDELSMHLSESGDNRSALAIIRRFAETYVLLNMGGQQ